MTGRLFAGLVVAATLLPSLGCRHWCEKHVCPQPQPVAYAPPAYGQPVYAQPGYGAPMCCCQPVCCTPGANYPPPLPPVAGQPVAPATWANPRGATCQCP